ncbi:MAG: phosphatase PAP2 family protein [Actinomycetia bacterium]|nr:phosphatase PAP2 family protein [Actinomycetes bacterium]
MSVARDEADSAPSAPPARPRQGRLCQYLAADRAPRLWQELVLIAVGYYLYRAARNWVPNQPSIALRHARSVEWFQDQVHIDIELWLNHLVAHREWLAQIMNYYYATLHFAVTLGVLVWLFVRRSRIYRRMRTALFATTLIGLAGFFLYPLAPPRLLPQYGYVDTLYTFHTWGSLADPAIAEHTNQYAAMPSLHLAWSVWCGAAIYFCARRLWVRSLGVAYPICTLIVIIGTANHFMIDAIAGAVAAAAGFGAQWLLSGRPAHIPTPTRERAGTARRPELVGVWMRDPAAADRAAADAPDSPVRRRAAGTRPPPR